MDKKTTLEMIAAISNANGTSGFEDEVVAAIRPYAEGLGEITEDRMRNLYIRRKENNGKRPVVQLDAHSDEVGFMVQAICPNGTLRIIQIGGWVNHNIPAHKVLVRNRFGEYIPGLTASKPPHFMTEQERKAPLPHNSDRTDTGGVERTAGRTDPVCEEGSRRAAAVPACRCGKRAYRTAGTAAAQRNEKSVYGREGKQACLCICSADGEPAAAGFRRNSDRRKRSVFAGDKPDSGDAIRFWLR